jgi:GTPase involved in cell partitioning and DNA repair
LPAEYDHNHLSHVHSPPTKTNQAELTKFDRRLAALPSLVIANKADALSQSEAAAALELLKGATSAPILPVSAVREEGLGRLAGVLRALAAVVGETGGGGGGQQ